MSLKNDYAIVEASERLGLTPRRVKAWLYGEVFRVAEREYRLLLHRWWADMDRQAAELRSRADEIERQAEAERLAAAQLTLPLLGGEITCSQPSSRGSVSGDGASRLIGGK